VRIVVVAVVVVVVSSVEEEAAAAASSRQVGRSVSDSERAREKRRRHLLHSDS
jgi:hypothetical protein